MPALLRKAAPVGRPFQVLVASNAVSSYGTYLNLVALNLYALEMTGSALSVGFFLLLRIGSSFLAGFVAGRLVVRFDPARLMIFGDLSQALALLGFVLAPGSAQAVLLYGLAAVMGGCSTLTGVARRSSVPDIVGQELRVRANGMLVTGRSLAMILGFASAGLVVAWAGYTAAFLMDAATFLVSAAALALLLVSGGDIRRRRATGPAATGPDDAEGRKPGSGRARRMRAAQLLRFAPVLLCLVALRAVDNMGSASHQVGLPVYAAQVAPEDAAAFVGRFYAVWAVGCLLAHQMVSRSSVASRWAGETGTGGRAGGERAFAVGTCLMSAFFILAFADLPTVVLLPVAAAAGLADGFTEIVYNSRLQALPETERGRLIGFAAMAETGALGVGTVLWASLLDHLAPFSVVAVAHGIAIVLALVFLLLLARNRMAPGSGRRPPDVRLPADPAGAAPGSGSPSARRSPTPGHP
jgi:MFS family permease